MRAWMLILAVLMLGGCRLPFVSRGQLQPKGPPISANEAERNGRDAPPTPFTWTQNEVSLESGQWQYRITREDKELTPKLTGVLLYESREVQPDTYNQIINTPFGTMRHYHPDQYHFRIGWIPLDHGDAK